MHVEAHGTEIPLLRIPIHADSDVQAGIERWAFEKDTGAVCALSAAPAHALSTRRKRGAAQKNGGILARLFGWYSYCSMCV